jgi:hypothetical protein
MHHRGGLVLLSYVGQAFVGCQDVFECWEESRLGSLDLLFKHERVLTAICGLDDFLVGDTWAEVTEQVETSLRGKVRGVIRPLGGICKCCRWRDRGFLLRGRI